MTFPSRPHSPRGWVFCLVTWRLLAGLLIVLPCAAGISTLSAQNAQEAAQVAQEAAQVAQEAAQNADEAEAQVAEETEAPAAGQPPQPYTPAIELLPDTAAGLLRIPNLPKFCEAFKQTHLGQMIDHPSMQPFIETQRTRTRDYFESTNNKVGLRPKDLYDIVTGEVVVAWLPFESENLRPHAVCVIGDTRGARQLADAALEQIDKDLIAGGATRRDLTYRGQEVRVYAPERKPGQLKIEQIALALSDTRIIAADRESVVTDLLDAIAGKPNGESISNLEEFKTVLTRSADAIKKPWAEGGGAVAAEWFARPFQMGRILRETFNVDRGNEVDIIKLLEGEGFDAIKAAGGIAVISGEKYDVLHRAFILAPDELQLAARMLQFVNTPLQPLPQWIHDQAATFNRIHLRIEEAFWASETLINTAMGDNIFRPVIDGILEDEEGPQIDIAGDVLPNLDDQIILITDSITPITVDSERMLVAIRVLDEEKIKESIRKWLEVEPDTSKLDVVPGVEIWKVEQGAPAEEAFDSELFGDLGLDDFDEQEPPPLLEHWAIALVEKGPGSTDPYLLFSSHLELLIETVKRIQGGKGDRFDQLESVKRVVASMRDLGCNQPAIERIMRLRLSHRSKYELLRQGKLKESDSVSTALYRRLFEEEDDEGEPDRLNAAKLPPFAQIEQFLPDGGGYFEAVEDGWKLTGFLLK